jgi:two-component system response regulator HydG
MLALTSYDWPGNVRELENAIERAVVFTSGNIVPLSVLPQNVSTFGDTKHSLTFKIGTPLREIERQAIEFALQHSRGDKNLAARLLGIATRTIYRHLEREGGAESESRTADKEQEQIEASM